MNRCAVRTGSALALSCALVLALHAPALAASSVTYTLEDQRYVFTQIAERPGGTAISIDDPQLANLLDKVGATIDRPPDSPYVLLTTAQPVVVTFAIGETTYHVGPEPQRALLAPFVLDGHVYIALDDILKSLNLPTTTGAAPAAPATPVPSPAATPAPSPAIAQISAVDVLPQRESFVVRIAIDGNATYQWHRLRPPDNRWWIDVQNARLATAPINQPGNDLVSSVRVHQQGPATVRVALSLGGFETVRVTPGTTGVDIVVESSEAPADVARSGGGSVGTTVSVLPQPSPSSSATYRPTNPRLIIIDPGHGGSDPGTTHGDLQEKNITLDIAKRLRQILIARGWQVMLTRDGDSDVYAPNDSASQELQARDDLANRNGARLLVSIHVNSYVNAGPHGVTTFYYKSEDLPLARAIDRSVVAALGIKDDGVIKDKLYVIHHANMPAALIETAFMSNPDDLQLLEDPAWRQKMAEAIATGIITYATDPH